MAFEVPSAPSPRRAAVGLATLATAAFCFVTTEILPIGLLTLIADDLRRSVSTTGLLVTGYAAVVLLASVPLAWLTRRMPRRQLLAGTLAAFTVATLLSAAATSYLVLLLARLGAALAQALFWSVVASTAAALFPASATGRVVARLALGNALAPVVGVPAGVWLAQVAGWRAPFLLMAGLGAVVCAGVLWTLPRETPKRRDTGRGTEPDARRYALVLVVTALAVTGVMGTFTYITPFLLEVSAFGAGALGSLMLICGLAGLAGTWSIGPFLDRHPRHALTLPLLTVAAGLAGLAALAEVKVVAVAALAVLAFGFNALAPAIQNRTLHVAPGSVDVAAGGSSAVFNAGIATGSLVGGLLVTGAGLHAVPLVGAAAAAAALAVAAAEPRSRGVAPKRAPTSPPARRGSGITTVRAGASQQAEDCP